MGKLTDFKVLEQFKQDFSKVKQLGWIPSNRFHDTGIGKTFEDFIGVIENNKPSADYKGMIELKSARELSKAMITLFTKSPEPQGVNTLLREKFGYYDEEHKDLKILHTTFSADGYNTCKDKYGFMLVKDSDEDKINIQVKNILDNSIDNSLKAYYSFDKLREIIENKCRYIIFISAESKKENGKEFFKFNKAIVLSGLTFEKFIISLKQGIIKYDIRAGVYRTGKNKGKTHDHGSGFRIFKKDLNKVFTITELC